MCACGCAAGCSVSVDYLGLVAVGQAICEGCAMGGVLRAGGTPGVPFGFHSGGGASDGSELGLRADWVERPGAWCGELRVWEWLWSWGGRAV